MARFGRWAQLASLGFALAKRYMPWDDTLERCPVAGSGPQAVAIVPEHFSTHLTSGDTP